ncbi:vacuolar-sorting protein SNF8/VPS22 [Pseudohyphozyma bogoriensis]|nr:vacuolar-sorting protein SNF8/VPS22 [Pseudohyphozyma bogoriensis]
MSRRPLGGYSSLQRHLDNASSYSTLSTTISTQQTATLQAQLATFQTALSNFSSQHRAKILSSPEFRDHFSQLCNEIGVDPLGGGEKGLWDKMGVGDWYYALGVQVVDVCLRVRDEGGGLVGLDELIRGVMELRRPKGVILSKGKGKAKDTDVSEGDIARALATLEPLGCGYSLVTLSSGAKVVQCYPGGLDRDSMAVVEAATANGKGWVTVEEVGGEGWTLERRERAMDKAVKEGLGWVDDQVRGAEAGEREGGRSVWVLALFEFGV